VADSGGAVAAGVVFGILLPTALLALSFYLVIKHLTMVVSWRGLALPVLCTICNTTDVAAAVLRCLGCSVLMPSPAMHHAPPVPQIPLRRAAYFLPDEEAERSRKEQQLAAAPAVPDSSSAQAPDSANAPGSSSAGGDPGPSTSAAAAELAAAELARASAGAASDASRSSGAGSSLGAQLLCRRSCQHGADAGDDGSAAAEAGADATLAPPPRPRLRRRLKRALARWFVQPVFGFHPSKQGEWVPPDGYDARCESLAQALPAAGRTSPCAIQLSERSRTSVQPPVIDF
jgi:hypothetical protein